MMRTVTQAIFHRQWIHLLGLTLLLPSLALAARWEPVRTGAFLGLDSHAWFWLAAVIPAAHQTYVWLCWRLELYGKRLSQWLGQRAFSLFALGFAVLGLSRVAVVVILAVANRDTMPMPEWLGQGLALLALLPALYLFYSVKRYFGFRRALGADHFDPSYRSLPLVKEGIFRYTSNGMYVYGFLILWVPALWFTSAAALAIALFNHLYIWVHYFATEHPDMEEIYS